MDRVRALWEGGDVERLHIVPHLRPYTVAQHCWRMGALLYALHPAPSRELMLAVQFHDSAERWCGDLPATVKWWIAPEAGRAVGIAEEVIKQKLGVHFTLTKDEQRWLKALDILELYLFCRDELDIGNSNVRQVAKRCGEVLRADWIPQEVFNWMETMDWERTDDAFELAE